MARGKMGFLPSAALLGVFAAFIGLNTATAQTISGGEAGGSDDLAPGPVANLSSTLDLVDVSIALEWDLSEDDFDRQVPAGGDLSSGGAFVNTNDVAGYEIWRSELEGDFELLATVDAGVSSYTDSDVVTGVTYTYQIVAIDAAGNSSEGIQSETLSLGPPPDSEVVPPPRVRPAKRATLTFDVQVNVEDTVAVNQFRTDLITLLAQLLGIDPSRIRINSVIPGSTIVDFEILPAAEGEEGPTADAAAAELVRIVQEEPEAFSSIGPVLDLGVLTSGELDFGTAAIDEVLSETFTFSNTSDDPDAVLSIASRTSGTGFAVTPASLILGQGESGEVTVSFSAAAVNNLNGTYTGRLTLTSNDPDNLSTVVDLSAAIAEGLDLQAIELSTLSLNFGQVGTDSERTRTVTISNTGDLDLTGEVTVEGDQEFSVSSTSFVIPGGATFDVGVTFSPSSDRVFNGSIVFSSDDPINPARIVEVTGTGVTGIIVLQDDEGNQIFGDLNGDAEVNFDDFFIFADNFGADDFDPAADLDGDGDVDFDDFFIFADNFGKSGTYVTLGVQAGTNFTAAIDEAQAGDTGSAGSGSGTGSLNAAETEFNFSFTVSGLADVTAVHFHNAPAGSNGGVVRDLGGDLIDNGDGTWTIAGVWASDDTQPLLADELKAGNVYINVHTTAVPAGEIRGQVVVATE